MQDLKKTFISESNLEQGDWRTQLLQSLSLSRDAENWLPLSQVERKQVISSLDTPPLEV